MLICSCVVQFVKLMSGSQPVDSGELDPCVPDCTAPPADTRRVYSRSAPCGASQKHCACTFYLVFKEPDDWSARRIALDVPADPPPQYFLQGNLTILLTTRSPCQPLPKIFFRRPSSLPEDASSDAPPFPEADAGWMGSRTRGRSGKKICSSPPVQLAAVSGSRLAWSKSAGHQAGSRSER